MSFWSTNYWQPDYWPAEYWAQDAPPVENHTQYPSVVLTVTPSSVQSTELEHSQTGNVQLDFIFGAVHDHVAGTFDQTGNVQITFSPAGTQTAPSIDYEQTADVAYVTNFQSAQYIGLIHVGDASFTVGFSASQSHFGTIGFSQTGTGHFVPDPYGLQLYLTAFFGVEAVETFDPVEGYPKTDSTGVLAPAKNLATEQFFEFMVYSTNRKWLHNSGSAGAPVYIEVRIEGAPEVSVNLYKSKFVVDYTMGSVYTAVRDGLINKDLTVTLRGYEKFNTYALAEELSGTTTIRVRAYNERRTV